MIKLRLMYAGIAIAFVLFAVSVLTTPERQKRTPGNCSIVGEYAMGMVLAYKPKSKLTAAYDQVYKQYAEASPTFLKDQALQDLFYQAGSILQDNWDLFVSLPRGQVKEIAKTICLNKSGNMQNAPKEKT